MIKKAEERIVQGSTPVIQDISYDEIRMCIGSPNENTQ